MASVAYVTHSSSYLDGSGGNAAALKIPSSSLFIEPPNCTLDWLKEMVNFTPVTFELLKLGFSLCVYAMRCVAERFGGNVNSQTTCV
jgi:hypothetical protein